MFSKAVVTSMEAFPAGQHGVRSRLTPIHSTVNLCLRTNCGSCRPNCSCHFRMLSRWCPYKLFVFPVIMVSTPVGFSVPQMQERLDKREALDCFILDYIDYYMVMGWFERKDGFQYEYQSEDGKKQWKKRNLCMSTLRVTLPSTMKRLISPHNKMLGLSE